MDILLLNILISNHQKFSTKRFFLLNRNTLEISHARLRMDLATSPVVSLVFTRAVLSRDEAF